MIRAIQESENLIIDKISIVDAKKVNYTNFHALNKKQIYFDDDVCVSVIPLVEDVRFPSSARLTDSGTLYNYKVEISLNNQNELTISRFENFSNKKVICVMDTNLGRIIIGTNTQPLTFLFDEDNSVKASDFFGSSITLAGNTYYCKVKP